ncbi:MAG: hypothetical protein SFV19_06365 [Rhodospirillaceae bacterium]|nr:hypothetical protein [Rhodospirillaceae bacterium]
MTPSPNQKFALTAVVLWTGATLSVAAAQDRPTESPLIAIPSEYIIGYGPASGATAPAAAPGSAAREKTSSVGTDAPAALPASYTVIAPIFRGNDGNLSYIRFVNLNAFATQSEIHIVGFPSGNEYAVFFHDEPAYSSRQRPITEVLELAGLPANPLQSGDTGFSVYLKNSNFLTGFQHVIYNSANQFFENVSICTYARELEYPFMNSAVVNVHTSLLAAGFPSLIHLHNREDTSQTFRVRVTDSNTGATLGFVNMAATANTTYSLPSSFFQQQINFTPNASQFHMNLIFDTSAGGTVSAPPNWSLGHMVLNTQFNAYFNLTTFCSIND